MELQGQPFPYPRNVPGHTFWIGLSCAALLHACMILSVGRAAPRQLGERDGTPDAISVELVDPAELRGSRKVGAPASGPCRCRGRCPIVAACRPRSTPSRHHRAGQAWRHSPWRHPPRRLISPRLPPVQARPLPKCRLRLSARRLRSARKPPPCPRRKPPATRNRSARSRPCRRHRRARQRQTLPSQRPLPDRPCSSTCPPTLQPPLACRRRQSARRISRDRERTTNLVAGSSAPCGRPCPPPVASSAG